MNKNEEKSYVSMLKINNCVFFELMGFMEVGTSESKNMNH